MSDKYGMTQYSDQMIYEQLRSSGVVHSQYEFSRLCGRCVSWFSSSRCQQREITTAALTNLAINLEARIIGEKCAIRTQRLRDLARRVRREMWRRSLARIVNA